MQRRSPDRTRRTPYGDPSAKIWGLYLSQSKELDKDDLMDKTLTHECQYPFYVSYPTFEVIEHCTHTEALVRLVISP
jgi:hypothetical protein